MNRRPHDVSDLYLAPVLLEPDHRVHEFEGMSQHEIELHVALETDREPRDPADRADIVLLALTQSLNLHKWTVNWAPRGLQVSHTVTTSWSSAYPTA
jgi:hypothetical protein